MRKRFSISRFHFHLIYCSLPRGWIPSSVSLAGSLGGAWCWSCWPGSLWEPRPHPRGASSRSGGTVRWGSSAIVRMLPHAGSKAGLAGLAQRSPKISPSSPHGARQLLKGCTMTAAASGICWWAETWGRPLKSGVSVTNPSFPWKPLIQPFPAPGCPCGMRRAPR